MGGAIGDHMVDARSWESSEDGRVRNNGPRIGLSKVPRRRVEQKKQGEERKEKGIGKNGRRGRKGDKRRHSGSGEGGIENGARIMGESVTEEAKRRSRSEVVKEFRNEQNR